MSESLLDDPTMHVRPLQEVSASVPEIAENIEAITTEGTRLVKEYGVEASFFDEPADTMLFAGLAQRSLAARAENGGTEEDRKFVDAASKLLFMGKSSRKDEFAREVGEGDTLSDDELVHTYNQLTNQQVTAELQAAFDTGFLADVKAKLGVTEGNEQPFTLHVLNMGAERLFDDLEPDDPDDKLLFEDWRGGLVRNNAEFARLTGNVGNLPAAQVMHLDNGSKHMLIPLPVAEKLLHPELINPRLYDESKWKQDVNKIKHEYVHTQRPTIHSYAGFALEERRADYVAGTHGM